MGERITDISNSLNNFGIVSYGDVADMNDVLTSGSHFKFARSGTQTLNTPFSNGLTTFNTSLILSYATSTNYGTQIAIPSGQSKIFIRSMNNGVIGNWSEIGNL